LVLAVLSAGWLAGGESNGLDDVLGDRVGDDGAVSCSTRVVGPQVDAPRSYLTADWSGLPGEAVAGGFVGGRAVQDAQLPLAYREDPYGTQDWLPLVCSFQWPCATALRILGCESGGRALAVNITGHVGLFQISPIHRWSREEMLVPAGNVAAAHELWQRSGWWPWVSSAACWRN